MKSNTKKTNPHNVAGVVYKVQEYLVSEWVSEWTGLTSFLGDLYM